MTFFEQFFSNTIFLTAAFGWLVAQVLKTLIHLIVSKKFVAERLVGSGGMPSSHSATVCALVTAVCYEYGAGSFEFAISLILAIIVMYASPSLFIICSCSFTTSCSSSLSPLRLSTLNSDAESR